MQKRSLKRIKLTSGTAKDQDNEVYKLIERIAEEHSKLSKPFGYLDENDLKNEIWVICLEKLDDFDTGRGQLEHFLRVSVKNRLINRFKDITKSVRPPCPRCPYYSPENLSDTKSDCLQFGFDKHLCGKWHNYQLSVESRNSLLNASEQQIERKTNNSILNRMVSNEIKDLILMNIDKNFLFDFNELISGGKISKQKLKRLKKEIFRILEENNYKTEEFVQLSIKGEKNATTTKAR